MTHIGVAFSSGKIKVSPRRWSFIQRKAHHNLNNMKISPDYMNYDDSFKKFIISDEGKRGYLISLKGESNTTLRGFMKGLFLFFFTRRFVTISAYNDNALRVITNNYVDRINQGRIKKYKDEDINRVILSRPSSVEDSGCIAYGVFLEEADDAVSVLL